MNLLELPAIISETTPMRLTPALPPNRRLSRQEPAVPTLPRRACADKFTYAPGRIRTTCAACERVLFLAPRASEKHASHFCDRLCRDKGIVLHGDATIEHGRRTPEYRVWVQMNQRCSNPRSSSWADYGGRGIRVCDRWRASFSAFLDDMGRRPTSKHTIDRIDNDRGYEPENCRWATRHEQNSNNRRNRIISCFGETLTITEWSRRTGISVDVIGMRVKRGWDVEQALTTPAKGRWGYGHKTRS